MAIEHRDLTGAQLHEPKGVETAANGTVYTADGSGSGSWVNPLASILNKNKHVLSTDMNDIGAASNPAYFRIPFKSQLRTVSAVLYQTIDANTIFSIYINGTLYATETLTLTGAGSAAGSRFVLNLVTPQSLAEGALVEIRSDGGTNTSNARADVQLVILDVA